MGRRRAKEVGADPKRDLRVSLGHLSSGTSFFRRAGRFDSKSISVVLSELNQINALQAV